MTDSPWARLKIDERFDKMRAAVRACPGRLSALSVSHSKSVLYGGFVWACISLNDQKWRFPARAVRKKGGPEAEGGLSIGEIGGALRGTGHCRSTPCPPSDSPRAL